jgi:hypothetical protein
MLLFILLFLFPFFFFGTLTSTVLHSASGRCT